jgi:hypothetical protein
MFFFRIISENFIQRLSNDPESNLETDISNILSVKGII